MGKLLPKEYLNLEDVADYFNSKGATYDYAGEQYDRRKLLSDVLDLVRQKKLNVFVYYDGDIVISKSTQIDEDNPPFDYSTQRLKHNGYVEIPIPYFEDIVNQGNAEILLFKSELELNIKNDYSFSQGKIVGLYDVNFKKSEIESLFTEKNNINNIDEYLSIDETIKKIKETTEKTLYSYDIVEYSKLEMLTPMILFSGFVGMPIDDKKINYEKMKGYFYHEDLLFKEADINGYFEFTQPFKINSIIRKQTNEYKATDEVFLFSNIPSYTLTEGYYGVGYECEQQIDTFHLNDVKFRATEVNQLASKIGYSNLTDNNKTSTLTAELDQARTEITQLKATIAELEKQLAQAQQATPADGDDLSEKSKNSHLITIGLLIELLTTPKIEGNKPTYPSNAKIIEKIEQESIYGQKKTTLENRFSEASNALTEARKK